MILGFISKYNNTYLLLIKTQGGILNGIEQNLVNLQSINLINITIGIVTVQISLMLKKILMIPNMVKLENYP